MKRTLTAEAVNTIFTTCFVPKENAHNDSLSLIEGSGCGGTYSFIGDLLMNERETIKKMLLELPKPFMKSSHCQGWSFMEACVTREGIQWGEHINIEQLITMGNALKLVTFPFPEKMWHTLPGSMPYIEVQDELG
jgi:hypothetical protein